MRAAGVNQIGGAVALLELAEPRALRADEILLDIRACGVGNWDEFVRTGGWDIRYPSSDGARRGSRGNGGRGRELGHRIQAR